MRLGSLVLVCLLAASPALADEAVRTGAAAFGDWRDGRARRTPPDHAGRPAGALCDAFVSEHVGARSADRGRRSQGAAGLRGRSFRQRAQYAARHSHRAEWRYFRCRNRSRAGARLSRRRRRRWARARRDLRRRLAAAIWDRLLPFRSGSEVCLCRDAGLRRPLSLSQRRDESGRSRREDRKPAKRRRALDSRPRLLA